MSTSAEMLRNALERLDAHVAETDRLIHDPNADPFSLAPRADARLYLNARVLNAARMLLSELENAS